MSYVRTASGTIVVTVRFTFDPYRDPDHIRLVEDCHPDGPTGRAVDLSKAMREAMRNGIIAQYDTTSEEDLSFDILAEDL